jgi:hypothetical protein
LLEPNTNENRYILDSPQFYADIALLPVEDFKAWKQIHERIRVCFERLWTCIYAVLCADAPEGHVPDEIDEEASLDTKEILSYSWRGLKEARYESYDRYLVLTNVSLVSCFVPS